MLRAIGVVLRLAAAVLALAAIPWFGLAYLGHLSADRNRELLAPAPACLTNFFKIVAVEGDAARATEAKRVLQEARTPCAKFRAMSIAFRKMAVGYLNERPNSVVTLRRWLERGGFTCEQNESGSWVGCDCSSSPIFVYYWPCTECTPMLTVRGPRPHRIHVSIEDYEKLYAGTSEGSPFKTRFEASAGYQAGPDQF